MVKAKDIKRFVGPEKNVTRALWDKQERYIAEHGWGEEEGGKPSDPDELLRRDLRKLVVGEKTKGREVLIFGDWNERRKCRREGAEEHEGSWWKGLDKKLGLVDVQALLHGDLEANTRRVTQAQEDNGQTEGRLDYFLATKGLVESGAVRKVGVLKNLQVNESDHRLCMLELDMRIALNINLEDIEGYVRPDITKLNWSDKREPFEPKWLR